MKRPNISMIVLDSLRLSTFNEIINKGGNRLVGFESLEQCIAPAPWTLPSHASIFTGLYPSEHGAHESKNIKSLDISSIKLKLHTFVGELNRLGYNTYAISANPYVHPIYGFNEFGKFFEETYFTDVFGSAFEIPKRIKGGAAKYRNIYGNNPTKIAVSLMKENPALALDLLEGLLFLTPINIAKKFKAKFIEGWPLEKGGKNIVNRVMSMEFKEPFFLFINMMESHDPYIGVKKDVDWSTSFMKEKPSESSVELWKRLYYKASDKAINYADKVMASIQDRFGENQVNIVTSDHGQEFNEHGFIGHGVMLHDEIVKVPFTMKIPKGFDTNANGKYLSLVNVKDFILSIINGDVHAVRKLYRGSIHSESFGIPANMSIMKGIDKIKLERNDVYRQRSFH